MGMFVTAQGNTSRPPLQWVVGPDAIAYNFPYIIGLCAEQGLLTIHSILDQTNKQVISYQVGTRPLALLLPFLAPELNILSGPLLCPLILSAHFLVSNVSL